jgi:hypothetical protein
MHFSVSYSGMGIEMSEKHEEKDLQNRQTLGNVLLNKPKSVGFAFFHLHRFGSYFNHYLIKLFKSLEC